MPINSKYFQDEHLSQTYQTIKVIKEFINSNTTPRSSRGRSIIEVAKRLRVFACQHLDFFQYQAIQQNAAYPPEYINGLIHDQVARDFSILREAFCQSESLNYEALVTLATADNLAQTMIKPLVNYGTRKVVRKWIPIEKGQSPSNDRTTKGARQESAIAAQQKSGEGYERSFDKDYTLYAPMLVEVKDADLVYVYPNDTIVITYFRKSPSIRLIPYAPVALIGIPFSSIHRKRDLLATPHELGHQIFWRWRYLRLAIQEALSGGPKYTKNWAEEIFADTFGVQAAGPAAALYAQVLEAAFSKEQFLQDDGVHPASVLRPYVHIKALERPKAKITEELAKAWTNYRFERTDRAESFNTKGGQEVRIDNPNNGGNYAIGQPYEEIDLNAPVDSLVKNCLDELHKTISTSPFWEIWLNSNADSLFPKIEAYIQNMFAPGNFLELEPDSDIENLQRKHCTDIRFFDTETWFNNIRDFVSYEPKDLVNSNNPIHPADWLPLMDMDAWADKGPTCNPRGT